VKIKKLTLKNFRNVEDSTFEPEAHLNFLVGQNGQGKTSFLEALGYFATLRSFRGSKSDEVIRWGSRETEISCVLEPDPVEATGHSWKTDLKILFQQSEATQKRTAKLAFINGKPYKSSTSYLTQRFGDFELGFHTVVFNPSDHDLVRGEPATRRGYLDRMLAAEDVEYLRALQKYQRVLVQRNALLRDSERPQRELLRGFTEPLVELGSQLTHKRLGVIQRLAKRLGERAYQIAPNQPFLRLVYLSNWVPETQGFSIQNKDLDRVNFAGLQDMPSLELLEQAFWQKLSVFESAEWKSGHSLVGPHRDDWAFFLGERPLRGHGSQGEVRSSLLALKLSEIELFRNETGHRPLFLLDDFSSELDRERRSFLLRFLDETDLQTFVTTTEDFRLAGKRFCISNGKINDHADPDTGERLLRGQDQDPGGP
jgi:DNA replication and repair protein RecF